MTDELTMLNGAEKRESSSEGEALWTTFESEAMPHAASLFRIARWLTRDHTSAEDLPQETLTEALSSFHRFTPGTNCRAWLVSIMYHSCLYESRRFAHIVLKYHDRLVSFLVTDATTEATPQSRSQSQVIACSQFEGYQVSCFQTGRHAGFIVSDMPEGDNLALARALASSVFAHITRVESATWVG